MSLKFETQNYVDNFDVIQANLSVVHVTWNKHKYCSAFG